jgi:peptide/nickel transport system ATP-binding protein
VLKVADLVVDLGKTRIVDGVSLEVRDGPYGLGLVGESGSGKSTILRALMRLVPVREGLISYQGEDVRRLRGVGLHGYRRAVQIVFQNPDTALDPRLRIGEAIREALLVHHMLPRAQMKERVRALLEEVDLQGGLATRYPHELSGGQRQRVVIARAMAVEPQVLLLDEPTSALDVTVQARVLDLVVDLRQKRSLAYLLVSHNLAVVEKLCDETVVLYAGRIVERSTTKTVLRRPAHPYTVALRSAVPEIEIAARRRRVPLSGPPADPRKRPLGCAFHPRCPIAVDICAVDDPKLRELTDCHWVACHRAEEVISGEPVGLSACHAAAHSSTEDRADSGIAKQAAMSVTE